MIANGHRFEQKYKNSKRVYWICQQNRPRHSKCPVRITQDIETNRIEFGRNRVHNHGIVDGRKNKIKRT